jgi:hypothetical protein
MDVQATQSMDERKEGREKGMAEVIIMHMVNRHVLKTCIRSAVFFFVN